MEKHAIFPPILHHRQKIRDTLLARSFLLPFVFDEEGTLSYRHVLAHFCPLSAIAEKF